MQAKEARVANTDDYKRGYSKGYTTGTTRSDKRLADMHDQQKRLAERVERAEKQQGLGHCEDCAHWTKGCDTCAWGYCNAAALRHAGTPGERGSGPRIRRAKTDVL